MKRTVDHRNGVAVIIGLLLTAVAEAQTEMPKPAAEHELLKQFAGNWEMKAEAAAAPGEEAMKCEGTESANMIGGFWLVSQAQGKMKDIPIGSVLTLGYDPATKKYVGTFVCSMDSTFWNYEGTMDAGGKRLILQTEGPSPIDPTKKVKFRETLELVDQDHKVFTSTLQGDDGNWMKIATIDYRRK